MEERVGLNALLHQCQSLLQRMAAFRREKRCFLRAPFRRTHIRTNLVRNREWEALIHRPSSVTVDVSKPTRTAISRSNRYLTSLLPKTGLRTSAKSESLTCPTSHRQLRVLKDFRNRGIFYEHVTNQILDDLVAALQPRRMTVVGDFSVRGGIKTLVTATYTKKSLMRWIRSGCLSNLKSICTRFFAPPTSHLSCRSYVDAAAAAGIRQARSWARTRRPAARPAAPSTATRA